MQFWVLLKKELLNLVRDRKAFIALFLPLILFPLIYLGLGTQLKNVEDMVENQIRVYSNVQSDEKRREHLQRILKGTDLFFVETSTPEEALKAEDIYLIIEFENENTDVFPVTVTLTYNTNSNYSTAAYSIVSTAFENANMRITCEKLLEKGVELSILDNIRLLPKEMSTNMMLVMIAPMLLTCLLVSGGASVAADIFAGEKERGTLEQLAVTQVKRSTLLYAKSLIVFFVTLLNATISLLAYYISMKIAPDITRLFSDVGTSVVLSWGSALCLIATILTFSLLISSVLILISLCAKSVKEAQTSMALLTMLPSLLSLLVMFSPMSGIGEWSMVIPVYNVLMGLKMIFADTVTFTPIMVMLLSQLLLTLLVNLVSLQKVKHTKFLL